MENAKPIRRQTCVIAAAAGIVLEYIRFSAERDEMGSMYWDRKEEEDEE